MRESTVVGRTAGRFGTTQLVAVELAALAVAVAVALPPARAALLGGAALVLLAVVWGRSGGRWGYEAVSARWQVRGRRRAARRMLGDPALAALAPDLTTTSVDDRSGVIGIGQDALGWFAAVAVLPVGGPPRRRSGELPLDWLARLANDAALPASTLQVVVRQVRLRPVAAAATATAAERSYLELCHTLAAPTHREVWIAARLSPRDAATLAADRGGGLVGVRRALAAAVGRISAGLNDLAVEHVVLDGGSLRQALARSFGSAPAGGGAPVAQERWTRWQGTRTTHVCFAVRGWPGSPHSDLLVPLTHVPDALEVSVAMVFGRRDDAKAGADAVARTLVRLVAAPDTVDACVRQLRAKARAAGLRLVRLDGEHAIGVCATAPTGATVGLAPW